MPADETGAITFASFNNPAKIYDQVINLWAEVLNAVPGSTLLLKYRNWYDQASLRGRMTDSFNGNGVGPERLIFDTAQDSFSEHLGRYGDVDIAVRARGYQ